MDLTTALQTLDPENNDHWTAQGAPVLDVLKEMTGRQDLTRKQVTEAAPQFSRSHPSLDPVQEDETPSTETNSTDASTSDNDDDRPENVEASDSVGPEGSKGPLGPDDSGLAGAPGPGAGPHYENNPHPTGEEEAEEMKMFPDTEEIIELYSYILRAADGPVTYEMCNNFTLEQLLEWKEHIEYAMSEVARLMSQTKSLNGELSRALNIIATTATAMTPKGTFTESIKAYQETSKRTMAERAARAKAVNQLLQKGEKIPGVSPVDAALAKRPRQLPSKFKPQTAAP